MSTMTTAITANNVSLPLELVLRILSESSQLTSTTHARQICLVCKASYRRCWPSLWRIICLRNARQLKLFSEAIYEPLSARRLRTQSGLAPGDAQDQARLSKEERTLRRKQDAVTFLYLNNNKDGEGLRALDTDEKPEMWMISCLLAARNLRLLHTEEYWSMSFPWENQDDKPLVAYPLMLLSRFSTAIHAAFTSAPASQWSEKMFGRRPIDGAPRSNDAKENLYEAIEDLQRTESLRRAPMRLIAQPNEITLSALAMSPSHLFSPAPTVAIGQKLYTEADEAFENLTHLHLYFAKLDRRLLQGLRDLPSLTHLRITRPFSELLSGGVAALLDFDDERSASGKKLQKLIIEAGIYMDMETVKEMRGLEARPMNKDRFDFTSSKLFPPGQERSSSGNSTTNVVNYVTSSEERGFHDFIRRAHGLDGVWQTSA